ncbi:glycerophosphodiester phosphodiesterase [Microlunatus sp. Gsoil 973]|uniref:glycerophosphodiester phosphodiesterase n=1 Tax=Microlunatus sp. Gsoil 973 TaxID=2672569 RepID=UPI0018A7EEE8|nr:glycerophosphodiester phosphodiesterase [Microlunatus sp. Gsoil 973]
MSRLVRGDGFHAIAHRGDPIAHWENTLPGIVSALSAGADLVEIDIKTTADGEVVLLHDDTLQRLWGDPRMIMDVPSDDLARIGDAEHRIPLLATVLDLIGQSSAALLIDMDHRQWAAPGLAVVAEAVRTSRIRADQICWCGRPDSLAIIREADPDARIFFSWDESNGDGRLPAESLISDLSPEVFNPHWPMINDATIDWATALGLSVSCWTVDDPKLMEDLLDRELDAMITNRIGLLQELRRDQ